jgi:hypothetical protein
MLGNLSLQIFKSVSIIHWSARKSKMERIKNEQMKEIMGVKGKPDIIDII